MTYSGTAYKFGNDIDTDAIIPARYLNTIDPQELAAHCMEDADPDFAGRVRPGDLIVGGKNFGCGSSREHAPVSIKGAGVNVVLAASFARIFYRNSFNTGLVLVESPEASAECQDGDQLDVDLEAGTITNRTRNKTYSFEPIPEFMLALVRDGGLIPHLVKKRAG